MEIKATFRYKPEYRTKGAACIDLVAVLEDMKELPISPGERLLIKTGLYLELPNNVRGEVLSRSGLAHAAGVIVLNAPGIIDPDYRGEIQVILINLGSKPYTIKHRQRIAQLGFTEIVRPKLVKVGKLSITQRLFGGFGSTGDI